MQTVIKTPAPKPTPVWLKHYPKYVKWDSELAVGTLPELWQKSAQKFADKQVVAFMGTHMTYAEMDAEIETMKRRLAHMGVKQGDHVGLCLVNTPWYFVAFHAVMALGGVVVNFNPLYTPDEITHQAHDSQIKHMITLDLDLLFNKVSPLIGTGHLEQVLVLPFAQHLPPLKRTLFKLLKRKALAKFTPSPTIHTPATLDLTAPTAPVATPKISMDDLAVLQYTGGTTGRAKGAMLSHKNITANIAQCNLWFPHCQVGAERMACFLPLFHVFAMNVCMNFTISIGGCCLLQPKFEINDTIKFMAQEKCTIFAGVPTIYHALVSLPEKTRQKLNCITMAVCGGAPLPAETKEKFETQMGVELLEGYGLSETSPVAAASPFDGTSAPSCIGMPMVQTEISLRSLDRPNVQVPKGERGEICIRGPQVMQGYWNKPDATADAFTRDGFFRTGDVGHFDDTTGFCYIVDRIKDLILCSGFNVYPRHIEEALYQHPAVLEAIVIGIPDDYRGESPKAFIKLRDDVPTPTEQDMLDFVHDKLSPMERPSAIEFRDELPKTIIGKLSKKELRDE